MFERRLAVLIGFIIYIAGVIWGLGEGYSVGVALFWPFGLLLLAAFGWAKLWTR